MLHTFFFVVSFVTDYRAVADAVQWSAGLGLVNAGTLAVVGIVAVYRNWRANRRGRERGMKRDSYVRVGYPGKVIFLAK